MNRMTNIAPDLNGFDSEQRAEIIAHRPDCPIHFDGPAVSMPVQWKEMDDE